MLQKEEITLKKFLSTALAIAMLTSTGFAFEDVKDSPYQTEINELYELGYITGDGEGNYNPQSFLLRSEAALLLLKGLYPLEDFEYLEYETVFQDVTRLHWAWKPIQVMSAYKVINGFGDGTFRPDEKVTAAQAISMCLKKAGYQEYIENDTVPWYKGVIEVANRYGFTEGLTFEPDAPITREQMAKLLYNTINIPLVLVTGWVMGDDGEPFTTTEIADKNSHRGYKSLLTETNNDITPPGDAAKLLGEEEKVVLETLGLKKEDYKIEGNPQKDYKINKIWKYHGRPVSLRLFFWNNKLFSVVYEFGDRLEEADLFGMAALKSYGSIYGAFVNKKEIDNLFLKSDTAGELPDFTAVWNDIDEKFMKDEAFTKNAEEMGKDIEFIVRVCKNEINTAYGLEGVEPSESKIGFVEIGMRFVEKKEN